MLLFLETRFEAVGEGKLLAFLLCVGDGITLELRLSARAETLCVSPSMDSQTDCMTREWRRFVAREDRT